MEAAERRSDRSRVGSAGSDRRLGFCRAPADVQDFDADNIAAFIEVEHNPRRYLLGFRRFDAIGAEPDEHRVDFGIVTRPDHRLVPQSKWTVTARTSLPSGRWTTRKIRPP